MIFSYFSPFFFFEGYSVGAGHFRSPHTTEVVGGAPQHEQIGKVRFTFLYLFLCKGLNKWHENEILKNLWNEN